MMFDIYTIADIIGSCAFAFSGFVLGVRKRLDVMGIFILSMLTASGGGALRDILVSTTPQVLVNPTTFLLVLGVIVTSFVFRLHKNYHIEESTWFVVSDSLGLVAFSITGALIGLEHGLSIFGVLVLSFLTAVGGGIIRDALVQQTSSVLKEGFYGSIAVAIGAMLYAFDVLNLTDGIYILGVFISAFFLRLIAHYKDWHLPKIG